MVAFHKKLAIPFSCVLFTLVAAPLGSRLRKGGRGLSLILSAGAATLAAPQVRPGEPTKPSVWVENRGIGEAVPTTIEAMSESARPLRVEVVGTSAVALGPGVVVQTRAVRQAWEHRLLTLQPGAVRIPHWHPDASELDYILQGKAQISLGFPDGEWERFELTTGQIAILPQGWFHSIQNVGEDVLRMLVIFNNPNSNDIGISIGFQAIPREALALTFGVPPERFDGLDLDVPYIAPK